MSGITIIGIGVGMIIFSVALLVIGVIYRKTVGSKIRKKLKDEYE